MYIKHTSAHPHTPPPHLLFAHCCDGGVLGVKVLGKIIILNQGVVNRRQGVNGAPLGHLHG